jgi:hypothetical protein
MKWSFEAGNGLTLNFDNTKVDFCDSHINLPTKSYFGSNEFPSMTSKVTNYSGCLMNFQQKMSLFNESEFKDKMDN